MFNARSRALSVCVTFFEPQRGKDDYKLAATSDGNDKKSRKAKEKKDMDDLKKEVDLVSAQKVPFIHF